MAKKILIVDDEPDLVKVVEIRLRASGYEVISAFDGGQGIARALEERPDLIILDVMMPAGDGYFVCENLKQSALTWSIPIIFLTAKDSLWNRAKAYELGARDYIKKPYESEVLLKAIKKALDPSEELKPREKGRSQILVIEEQKEVAEMVKHKLKELDYECIVAFSTEEGWDKAKAEAIDLILLDGATSGIDNHELFFKLRYDQNFKNVPVIVSTPKAELEKFYKELEFENIAAYVIKPFDYKELLDSINIALRRT